VQDEFSLLEGGEHDIFHYFELYHLFGEGVEHEDEVVIVRGIVFGFV
jgi:hypothetical protein